jgi:hypothetical protein
VCGGGGGLTVGASTGREQTAGGAGGGELPELDAEEPHGGRATGSCAPGVVPCLRVAPLRNYSANL